MSKYQAICPACGAFGAPELFLGEAMKREAIAKALRMPSPLAQQIQTYIGLFRPPKRGHIIDRVTSLLENLLTYIEPRKVTRNGRTLPAPVAIWQAALDDMLSRRDKLRLPLKDHGYLLEVVMSKADEAQAQAERLRHEQAQHRIKTGPHDTDPRPVADETNAWRRDMQRLGLDPEKLTPPESKRD